MGVLDFIAGNRKVAAMLESAFDFSLDKTNPEGLFRIEGAAYRVIGSDGSGNYFAEIASESGSGPILYICHEGQGGVIAENVGELFELIVSAPYWRDLLKFSGRGQLSEMQRALPILERELVADERDIREQQAFLRRELSCSTVADIVRRLHTAATRPRAFNVLSPEGEELESIFNRFVVDDNAMWRSSPLA